MTKKKNPEDLLPVGRKKRWHYSYELAKELCGMIATSTDGLFKICRENKDKFPCPDIIYEWKIDHPEFAEMYATAKRHQAEIFVDEIISISDNSVNDIIVDDDGKEKTNSEVINRSRLRVDSRKWIAAKLIPRIYGDKVQNETTVKVMGHEEWLRELK